MNIVFFCQSCGARFELPPTSAGKKGRCKHCGQIMEIPQRDKLASMVAIPALATASFGAAAGAKGKDSLSWLSTAPINVDLAPLSEENLRPIRRGGRGGRNTTVSSNIDDDLGDSNPYKLGEPIRPTAHGYYIKSRPASGLTMLWRRELGYVQKLFRWLNETAYLLSVPFLMMILFGGVVRSRPVALLGATVVVLLNLGRIVSGVANVVVIPFRDGIFQGVMFLIPPLTFFYLSNHWNKLKKPTMRIITPVLTIAAVFLAFTFIPSLRSDGKAASTANVTEEIKSSVNKLEGEMIDEVKKAKTVDVQGIERDGVKKVRDAAGQINSIGQPGTDK
jgi:hypothetical protein